MDEIMALFQAPTRTEDFFGKTQKAQSLGENTFTADFPPLDVAGSEFGNIQLPPDFWSPNFQAPQVTSISSLLKVFCCH